MLFYSTSGVKRIDSIPIGVESILLFIYIFYYFYDSLKNLDVKYGLAEKSSFWFITGIFIYLGITFFFNILGNTIELENIKKYYHFAYFGDIFKNILFTIAIYKYSKHPLKTPKEKHASIPFLDAI